MLQCEEAYIWFKENQPDKNTHHRHFNSKAEIWWHYGTSVSIGDHGTLALHIPSGLHWLLYLKLLGKIPEVTVAVCKICHFLLLD